VLLAIKGMQKRGSLDYLDDGRFSGTVSQRLQQRAAVVPPSSDAVERLVGLGGAMATAQRGQSDVSLSGRVLCKANGTVSKVSEMPMEQQQQMFEAAARSRTQVQRSDRERAQQQQAQRTQHAMDLEEKGKTKQAKKRKFKEMSVLSRPEQVQEQLAAIAAKQSKGKTQAQRKFLEEQLRALAEQQGAPLVPVKVKSEQAPSRRKRKKQQQDSSDAPAEQSAAPRRKKQSKKPTRKKMTAASSSSSSAALHGQDLQQPAEEKDEDEQDEVSASSFRLRAVPEIAADLCALLSERYADLPAVVQVGSSSSPHVVVSGAQYVESRAAGHWHHVSRAPRS
jgi:hypothetical protein